VDTLNARKDVDCLISRVPRASSHSTLLESPEEYIWRFDLEGGANSHRGYKDPLIEMVRLFLDDFLNMGVLTCDGEPVRVTGFAFNNKPRDIYDIFLEDSEAGGKQHEALSPLGPGPHERD